MKNHIQHGENLDLIASKAYASGELVIEGNLVGVAVTDIASGATGAVTTEGIYAFQKEAAATLVQGDVAYYDSATKKLDATNTNPAVGHVVAVSGDTVHLKIYGYKL